jgi:hypothetical protein
VTLVASTVGGTRQAEAAGTISLSAAGHVFPPLDALVLSGSPGALLSVNGLVEQGYQVVFSGRTSRIMTPGSHNLPLKRRDFSSSEGRSVLRHPRRRPLAA